VRVLDGRRKEKTEFVIGSNSLFTRRLKKICISLFNVRMKIFSSIESFVIVLFDVKAAVVKSTEINLSATIFFKLGKKLLSLNNKISLSIGDNMASIQYFVLGAIVLLMLAHGGEN
jgi:hypothetical protein